MDCSYILGSGAHADELFSLMAQTYARYSRSSSFPRFIVVIREPVSRLLSWFNHVNRDTKKGEDFPLTYGEPCTLDGMVLAGLKNYTQWARCYYGTPQNDEAGGALRQVVNHFGRERLLILTTDAVHSSTTVVMRAISAFLELPFVQPWTLPLPHSNAAHGARHTRLDQVSCETLRWQRAAYAHDQARLEALATEPGRPSMQPPYVRPMMPETQPCVLDSGEAGTLGRM